MRVLGTHRSSYEASGSGLARRDLIGAGLLLPGLLLAGCAAKPVITTVALTLVAEADANPDARGRASPLTVRVYVLKSPGLFEGADFFSLFEKDQATLGAEMLQREEMLLRPGESRKLPLTLSADAKALGFMAAYRDLDRARWRAVRAVETGKSVPLTATFGARQIRLEAK
ncbi:MAG: type VI secretion system lipoprotein TssJ [Comamonadaceae bacterium]|nr:MAG: type VI secretion system lipoprotein TssJ [Comamonadaceae bacterium]